MVRLRTPVSSSCSVYNAVSQLLWPIEAVIDFEAEFGTLLSNDWQCATKVSITVRY